MRNSLTTSHLIETDGVRHRLVSRSRMTMLFALWAVAMRWFSKD